MSVQSEMSRAWAAPSILAGVFILCATGLALAQAMSEQQIRCLQLQRELASAPSAGGGGGGGDMAAIQSQIAQVQKVYEGTRASMEDAGCFESFFIFGKGLVRSPKCISMNSRMEDAGRQLSQLQQQRDALRGGGGSKRRQAELQDALARNGCGGAAAPPQSRRGGGVFDWFGGREEIQPEEPQAPISRYLDPNGTYRSICVRLCDGFFYPISEHAYGGRLTQDATQCQSNCAAPAELYVYRPGAGPEQAISLSGSAYTDLAVAFKYRKEYVKGCSCKQAEYNPTDIETYNKSAEATAATAPVKGKPGKKPQAKAPAPEAAPAAEATPPAQLDLGITGTSTPPAPAEAPAPQAEAPPAPERSPHLRPLLPRRRSNPPSPSRKRRQLSRNKRTKNRLGRFSLKSSHRTRAADQGQQQFQFRPMLAARERKPQGSEQRLALRARRVLHRTRPSRARSPRPRARAAAASRLCHTVPDQ